MAKSSPTFISTVAAGVITAAILAAASFIPGAWAWFVDLLSRFWWHLQRSSEAPNWLLYLLGIFSVFWIIGIVLRINTEFSNPYVEDRYFGALWRWQYSNGAPIGIWAFCLRCDTVLVYSFNYGLYGEVSTNLFCETCNSIVLTQPGDKDLLVAKVHRQIDKKLRTREWKRNVPKP